MIDAFATHSHLIDHLQPIWAALPETERGTFYIGARGLLGYAEGLGITPTFGMPTAPGPRTLVANHHDLDRLPPYRPGIFVEHGAGQSYADMPTHPAYSGGERRQKAAVFLALNATTAARDRAQNPDAEVVVIGSPRLDALVAERGARVGGERPVVAFCWHWDCGLLPETRWAWPHYREAVVNLARRVEVLGHGHPRAFPVLRREYELHGIGVVSSFAEVVRRADVVVVDNSSAGPEAAACGIPVVWANIPTYRRDVFHGGRFWDWPRGQVSCDEQFELGGAVVEALTDEPHARHAREAMVNRIYPLWTRGKAARLAVAALCGTPTEAR